jgi:hypothetical protein
VRRTYVKESATAARRYDAPDHGPSVPVNDSLAHDDHLALLRRKVAAAQAELSLFESRYGPSNKNATGAATSDGADSGISVADSDISSVSKWVTDSNHALLRGDVTDVIVDAGNGQCRGGSGQPLGQDEE